VNDAITSEVKPLVLELSDKDVQVLCIFLERAGASSCARRPHMNCSEEPEKQAKSTMANVGDGLAA
jgi:hypothetical protein